MAQASWPVVFPVSALRHGYRDIAVSHAAVVIALEEKRAGFALVAVEGAAGDARHLLVVMDLDAVPQYSYV